MPMRNQGAEKENHIKEKSGGWRFAFFYFLAFSAVSFYGTYGSLYFKRRGVSDVQLGLLYSIPAWVGIFGPMVWGLISDALHQRKLPSFLMHFIPAILFPLFWFWNGDSFLLLCVMMGVFTFFFTPSIPLADAWTLDHIARRGGDYGRLRSWGSVGFVTALLLSILILKKSSMSSARDLLPVFFVFSGFRLLSAVYLLTLPDYHSRAKHPKLRLRSLRPYLHPFAITFFLAVFMIRFLFSPYYTFFTIFLDHQGIADNLKGIFWIVAVGAEIGLIAVSGSLLKLFGPVPLLLAGLAATAFRMFIYSLGPPWYVILAVQSLHAFTYGAFHVASIQIINRITPEEFRASGQTFYSALLGIGGVVGITMGGIWSQHYGLLGMFRIISIIATASVVLFAVLFSIWTQKKSLPADQPKDQ